MNRLILSLFCLLVAADCIGQDHAIAPTKTVQHFKMLARKIVAATNEEYESAREQLAKQALEVAEEDLRTNNAEGLLHWILSGRTASPAAKQATRYLIRYHAKSKTSVLKLLSYAKSPSAFTPELFEGFANADLTDDLRWIADTCNAIHQKSMLLIADQMVGDSRSVSTFERNLGEDLTDQLASKNLAEFESKVIRSFESIAKKFGHQRIGGMSVTELANGSIFEVRYLRFGKTAKGLSGLSVDGDQIDLEDYRGKVVLVDFWATWCSPCVSVIPKLLDLQRELDETQFSIIGVSADTDRSALANFVQLHKLSWPIIFDRNSVLQKRWQSLSLPSYYVIDKNGIVRYRGNNDSAAANVIRTILGVSPSTSLANLTAADIAHASLEVFDLNNDQELQKSEMPAEMKHKVDQADSDKNGSLSLDELTSFLNEANVTTETVVPAVIKGSE